MDQIRTLKIFFICVILVAIAGVIFNTIADNRTRNYEFNGVVRKITYYDKGTAIVIINGESYTLSNPDFGFNYRIQQGDSLIKKKNSMVIKLIKHNSRQILIFK